QQSVNFLYLERVLREAVMHRATLELPEGAAEPLDCWCEVESAGWKHEGGELIASLRMMTCMFARMEEDNSIMYFEQPGELEHRVAVPAPPESRILFEPSLDILSFTFSPAGHDRLDIRSEISLRGCVYCAFSHPSISEIELNENAPRHKDPGKLFLYFADQNETVWDIAKRYNTSANAIWEENEIETDMLPARRMLLIPIIS
ncbi:MAG: LysM peptidoglycan-binding domain-containing protein, partial [Oscillospiraceae bacterium]|nr:LysM peptidoglycan-binding domain-containing protein [Oscillospiraceae bacterium]